MGLHQKNSAGGYIRKEVQAKKMGSMARHGQAMPAHGQAKAWPWPRPLPGHGQAMAGPCTCAPYRGKHLTKKRTLKKILENALFSRFCIKKMRDVHTIVFPAESHRDLCYVSDNKGFGPTLVLSLN